jgi:hypothetical protein
MTTSSNPFAKVKSAILGPAGSAASDGVASTAAKTAAPAVGIIRFIGTIWEPCNLS